jgi:hypothetical protein
VPGIFWYVFWKFMNYSLPVYVVYYCSQSKFIKLDQVCKIYIDIYKYQMHIIW